MRRSACRSRPRDSGPDRRHRERARIDEPVAFGQHADDLGPPRLVGIRPVRRDVPLVRPQRPAGIAVASRRRRPCAHSAARSESERSSLGNVGVPVLPAIQSMREHVRASKTCSQARRAVPARWLKDRPLMMTSAASCGIRFCLASTRLPSARRGPPSCCRARALDEMRRAHLGLAVGGCCEHGHHARDAERARARVALAPAFGDDVDDDAAAAFPPIVAAEPLAVGTGRALRKRARSSAISGRSVKGAPAFVRRAANSRPYGTSSERPTQPVVAERVEARPNRRSCLPH